VIRHYHERDLSGRENRHHVSLGRCTLRASTYKHTQNRPVNHEPLISVVIPTFNRARQVQAALRSVLEQTYPEFEIIIVDDGSTDGTGEVLQRLIGEEGQNGTRVRYFFRPNQGQSAARNVGIEEARGEWVAFLDSDDIWFPEKLEWQLRALEQFKGKCSACITDARLVDNLGMDTSAFRKSGRPFEESLGIDFGAVRNLVQYRDPYWLSTLLVRTEVVKQLECFDSQLGYAEDHDFFFRLSLVTPFCYVNRPLSSLDRSRSPEGSNCRPWDEVEVRLRGSQTMFEKWLKLETKLPPDVLKAVTRGLRHLYSAWANWYLEHERYDEARQAVRMAMRYEPTTKLAIKWALTRVAPGFAKRISPKMRV
jgi:glycosyltransferase involved in cell wall biosynthesis